MVELLHADLTDKIIKAYYRVYNGLSQTLPEFLLERAMMLALEKADVQCVKQDEYQILYKDRLVGVQRLDIFVAALVVVEPKVATRIEAIHLAQLMSYLKTVNREVGLLFRFGGPEPEFARRVLTRKTIPEGDREHQAAQTIGQDGLLHPDLVYEVIGGLLDVFRVLGPGFIHRVYANACLHELGLRGLQVKPHRSMHVFFEGDNLGDIKFGHIQVEDKLLVFPTAIRDRLEVRIETVKDRMRELGVSLGILVNFNTLRLKPTILRVREPRIFGTTRIVGVRSVSFCQSAVLNGCCRLPKHMTGERSPMDTRAYKIASYGSAHALLAEGVQRFPTEMWQFRPALDRWTIHEILVHIADSEANSYVRCRRAVAEPGEAVMAYDEMRWAAELHYHDQSPGEALELFKWLRLKSYRLIQALPDSAWSNTMYHPENGTMTLDDWLGVYERHIPEHIAQMQANYEAWLAS